MTTEELGAIRKWAVGPGPHNVYQLEKDVCALLDEVEQLRGQNKILRDALIAVVAVEPCTREELALLMRMVYRSNVGSDTKARSMKAINALLATMP